MRKSTFTEKEIIEILALAETPVSPKDLSERYGVSVQTFYRWRRKYGGHAGGGSQRLKELEEENGRLKELVVQKELTIQRLKATSGRTQRH
ncbi:MAG: hypothetical protein E4H03_14060 [Myxococcales bacterium]|jgi:putative transposase|nr:MAG: hypothetical protein E4H03_14060 [Myxococcales bacterium]